MKNVRSSALHVRRWAAVFAFLGVSLNASAAFEGQWKLNVYDGATQTKGPVGSNFGVGGTSTGGDFQRLMAQPSRVGQTDFSQGKPFVPAGANGGFVNNGNNVALRTAASLPAGAAGAVIDVEAKVLKPSMAKALVNLAGKLFTPLQVGMALYDFFKEAGIKPVWNDSTKKHEYLKEEEKSGDIYFVGSFTGSGDPTKTVDSTSAAGVCSMVKSLTQAAYPAYIVDSAVIPDPSGSGQICQRWSNSPSGFLAANFPIGKRAGEPTIEYTPMTPTEVERTIADVPTYKPDSKVAQAVKEALDSGEKVEYDNPTVTGPSSVNSPTTTKTNDYTSPGGVPMRDTTTTTGRSDITYSTNNVNITNTTNSVTNTTNLITNTTTTTNSSTVSVTPTGSGQTGSGTDTPPFDLCKEHPEIIACQQLGDAPETGKVSNTQKAVEVVAMTFAGTASCPPGIQFTAFAKSYELSYAPLCLWLDRIKPLILALAGFLAAYILADSFKVT